MKRGGPPRRRTQLSRGGPLARGGPLPRQAMKRTPRPRPGPSGRRTPKTAGHRHDAAWQDLRLQAMWRANGACQAALGAVQCRGRGSQAHHLLPRSAGGQDHIDNLAWVCDVCHGWIHGHPHVSYRLGLLRWRGWQPPVPDDTGRLHYPNAIDVYAIGHDVWLPDFPTPAWRPAP